MPRQDKYQITLPKHSCEADGVEVSQRRLKFGRVEGEPRRRPLRTIQIPPSTDFLREWPVPPLIEVAAADQSDPFPLFYPLSSLYFDGKQYGFHQADILRKPQIEEIEDANGKVFLVKRYAYTWDGTIKDFYFLFRGSDLSDENAKEEESLAEAVNRQMLKSFDVSSQVAERDDTIAGDVDGWNEDSHTAVYYARRSKETDYFAKHGLWSIDPVGDWTWLNANVVPKNFLRKIRRYFESRPLEFLRDTGSYRIFHIVNQYTDLQRVVEGHRSRMQNVMHWIKMWIIGATEKLEPLEKARKMELDYQIMIWLSIWDARLKANIFQLREISMTDWFYTWVNWKGAIGANDLLTKNETHAFDDFWAYREKVEADVEDNDEEEAEDLENWLAGEPEDDEGEEETELDAEKSIS